MPRGVSQYDEAQLQRRLRMPEEVDVNWGSVVWQITGGGTPGSTNISDVSSRRQPTTVNGSTQISAAQSVYGVTSVFFNNSTANFIAAPTGNSADFAMGTGDFTVEGWVYQISTPLYSTFFEMGGHLANTGIICILGSGQGMQIYSGQFFGSSSSLTLNTWMHYAWSRNSGTMRQFINGAQVSSYTFSNNLTNVTLAPVWGQSRAFPSSGQYIFNGYMSDMRLTKGVGRYTSAFTPPTRNQSNVLNGAAAWSAGRVNQLQIDSPYLNRPPLIGD
jgi:hypothetical protein